MANLWYAWRTGIYRGLKSPISALMVVIVLAAGVAIFLSALTVFDAVSSNPLKEKDAHLYSVRLDNWDPKARYLGVGTMPPQLSYQDGLALLSLNGPKYKALSYLSGAKAYINADKSNPTLISSRATSRDFFNLFDIDFLFGSAWSSSYEQKAFVVSGFNEKKLVLPIVLSETLNKRLFNGSNSVGQYINMGDDLFSVVGVVKDWQPMPKIHDLNSGFFARPDASYIPFHLAVTLKMALWGNLERWPTQPITPAYEAELRNETTWLQFWVQFASEDDKHQFERELKTYMGLEQKKGRLLRSMRYALDSPKDVLVLFDVVGRDVRIMLATACIFLLICILNSALIFYTIHSRGLKVSGVYSALGASRHHLIVQYVGMMATLTFVGFLAGLGIHGFILKAFEGVHVMTLIHRLPNLTYVTVVMLLFVAAVVINGLVPVMNIASAKPLHLLKNAG